MRRLLLPLLCLGLGLCLTSCPGSIFNRRPNGKFQETPVNLDVINSDTDDYNSNIPINWGGQDYILFSSKRARGDKFNLVLKPLALAYDDKAKQLTASIGNFGLSHLAKDEDFYERLMKKANQDCNVLGPVTYSIVQERSAAGPDEQGRHLLLYADDSKGDLQIKFVHNFNDKYIPEGPFEVSWLNSSKDDAYPTFSGDFSTLYFCSNRDGNFDIFEVAIPTDKKQLLQTLLSDKPLPVTKNTRLSSPADDKCPHLPGGWSRSNDNVMYFVSDRSGGYGGFDIYYSTRVNGQWKQPVNIGSRINTTYDEYRPTTLREGDFEYHVGIFSSNRPGGKGGFDLYVVGFLQGGEIPYGN
ncbi:hypothetical protein [Telluribacter sp. SYSU D00476]|uniref:TolB family protein n=1 Tax=Telluribacter sp. SYSU D00476 TaxID=2811430 RepID=UPI001FF2609B|nr:hypothetical protein [Telluribacter sp. SYSU D00476]